MSTSSRPPRQRHGWSDKSKTLLAEPVLYDKPPGQEVKYGRRSEWNSEKSGGDSLQLDGDDHGKETEFAAMPDIEEEEEEDMTMVVAEAPNVRDDHVQSLGELDRVIQYQMPLATEDGIDLTLLTSCLVPPLNVIERDERWEFDTLFTRLSDIVESA